MVVVALPCREAQVTQAIERKGLAMSTGLPDNADALRPWGREERR
jgi:hypothetical protein